MWSSWPQLKSLRAPLPVPRLPPKISGPLTCQLLGKKRQRPQSNAMMKTHFIQSVSLMIPTTGNVQKFHTNLGFRAQKLKNRMTPLVHTVWGGSFRVPCMPCASGFFSYLTKWIPGKLNFSEHPLETKNFSFWLTQSLNTFISSELLYQTYFSHH